MKKTLMYYMTIILTILFILVSTYSYAAEITKESLTKFFEDFVKESENDGTIEVTDADIIINSEGKENKLQYDLTAKPTFSINMVFKNGMTYDECTEEGSKMMIPIFGFMAVAGINGADASDAMMYGMLTIMEKAFQQSDEEATITKENFVNAIEYAEKGYDKDVKILDDLFSMTIKKAELKGEEYIVETELVVDSEKDFSVLKGEVNEIGNTMANSIIGGLSNSIGSMLNDSIATTNNTISSISTPLPTKTPSTANIGTMPNAGFELNVINMLKVVLGLSILALIVYGIYNKRYNSK